MILKRVKNRVECRKYRNCSFPCSWKLFWKFIGDLKERNLREDRNIDNHIDKKDTNDLKLYTLGFYDYIGNVLDREK